MTKEERLKKRHNSEKRFKFYGLLSVSLALIFVLILIQNIASKGSSAFSRTTISVDISFDSKLLEIDGPITKKSIENAEFYDLSVESLLKIYPSKDSKEERQVLRLFSPDYEYEIKRYLIKNPDKINQIASVELTSSDDVDQLNKGNFPRDLPEDRRRVSNFQLNIYDNLVEEGKIGKKFNDYFFSKGDSRDPELAGIGGSLMGSFFTIVICLLLSFPIACLLYTSDAADE